MALMAYKYECQALLSFGQEGYALLLHVYIIPGTLFSREVRQDYPSRTLLDYRQSACGMKLTTTADHGFCVKKSKIHESQLANEHPAVRGIHPRTCYLVPGTQYQTSHANNSKKYVQPQPSF